MKSRKSPKKRESTQLPKREQERLKQLILFEEKAHAKGFLHIAGVDEAGRGPLAGPVVAAACMLKRGLFFEGINDSKLLTPKKRERLFSEIINSEGVTYAYSVISAEIIDQINILQATRLAMKEAVEKLPKAADYLLVDAVWIDLALPQEKIIKGDQLSQSIACASVIAKSVRDKLMLRLDQRFPLYGFASHKGYGTKAHLRALQEHGPCPVHRKSFAPVRALIEYIF